MLVQELFEARQKGVKYTEKSVKGKVVKIIATLEGNKSGRYTKLAGRYKEIDEELQRLQEERNKMNEELKAELEDLFDASDAVYTRVVETISLTASLAKQSEDSTKVDDSKVVERLLEDATPELRKQIQKLRMLFEKTVKARSPSLQVSYPGMPGKKRGEQVDESVVSITLAALRGMLARKLQEFRSWATKYDKKLEKIRALMEPSIKVK